MMRHIALAPRSSAPGRAEARLTRMSYHLSSLQVVGDHTRACVYLVSDGVAPSNVGRGYVLRRLLRRVVMKVRDLTFGRHMGHRVCRCARRSCYHGRGLFALPSEAAAATEPNRPRLELESRAAYPGPT